MCTESILEQAAVATGRKDYRLIVEYMFALSRLLGGEEVMKELTNTLIYTYSSRTAFKAETTFFLASI